MTTLRDFGSVLGRALDTFFGSHKFMVMALGLCVKWPLVQSPMCKYILQMVIEPTCKVLD